MSTARNSANSASLPDGWRMARLGDVANVTFSPVDKKIVTGETPARLCNYTDVFYNRRISPEMNFMVATATQAEIDRWVLKRGDVLFTKDSETPDQIGIPAYVTQDMTDVLCGYHLGLARPDKKMVEGAYLAEVLASPQSASEFGRIANGVTRFGLTLPGTQALPILLPPLEEQRGIAAVLDSIDETIEWEEAIVAATEQLRDAMLHELLTRGILGRHTEYRDVPGLGTIPACWEVVRLGEVAEVRNDQLPMDEQRDLPYIGLEHIASGGTLLTTGDAAEFTSVKNVFRAGDTLYGKLRPNLRKVLRVDFDGLSTTEILPVTARASAHGGYVGKILRTDAMHNHSMLGITGTKMPRTSWQHLKEFRLPLPSMEEQQAIAEMLDRIEASINAGRIQTDNLKSLKASAADALLSGKVRVRGK